MVGGETPTQALSNKHARQVRSELRGVGPSEAHFTTLACQPAATKRQPKPTANPPGGWGLHEWVK
eukprot:809214-Amphidinium_carterae.1